MTAIPEPPEPEATTEPAAPPQPPPVPPRPVMFKTELPSGALEVIWIDLDGQSHSAPGLALTPTQVEFHAGGGVPCHVERLICPGLQVEVRLTASDVDTGPDGSAVATLQQFQNGVDDRMLLIDLVTRLGEG